MELITQMHDLPSQTKLTLALNSSKRLNPELKKFLPEAVGKLGRYYSISYELVCVARSEEYSIFNSITIETSSTLRPSQPLHVDKNVHPLTALPNILRPERQSRPLKPSLERCLGKPIQDILDEFRVTIADYYKSVKCMQRFSFSSSTSWIRKGYDQGQSVPARAHAIFVIFSSGFTVNTTFLELMAVFTTDGLCQSGTYGLPFVHQLFACRSLAIFGWHTGLGTALPRMFSSVSHSHKRMGNWSKSFQQRPTASNICPIMNLSLLRHLLHYPSHCQLLAVVLCFINMIPLVPVGLNVHFVTSPHPTYWGVMLVRYSLQSLGIYILGLVIL